MEINIENNNNNYNNNNNKHWRIFISLFLGMIS